MKMVGAAEFKAHCLRIFDEIAETGESVTVTRRGKPIAVIGPVQSRPRTFVLGGLKGSVLKYEQPYDPAVDPAEVSAIQGRLEDEA